MKINKQFNTFSLSKYIYIIDNHKKYIDFNTLGLYRSLIENNKLSIDEKIQVRDYAHTHFIKFFNFLQVKDPDTFIAVTYLGEELTSVDMRKIYNEVYNNQEKILKSKKIKHRNFGDYSKHNCGYDNCPYNGLMVRSGSWLAERSMSFHDDKNNYSKKQKSLNEKINRKNKKNIINNELKLNL